MIKAEDKKSSNPLLQARTCNNLKDKARWAERLVAPHTDATNGPYAWLDNEGLVEYVINRGKTQQKLFV